MYTYTIIIPHRNIPKLLQRCLDSIPQREDLHVIVVDDNSDADKVDFNLFPGYDRNDVELIFTKEGKGAGYARNVGLEHANSEKVLFADADDFFNYCINDILDEYKKDDSDIVFFDIISINSDTYIHYVRGKLLNTIIEDNYKKDPKLAIMQLKYDQGAPWCKLIRKSLIDEHKIKFDETIIHNDTHFSYLIGFHSSKVLVDSRALMSITYRQESITYTLSEEKILTRMKVFAARDYFMLENNIPYSNINNMHIKTLAHLYESNKNLYDKCINVIKTYKLDINELEKRVKIYVYKRKISHIKNRVKTILLLKHII